MKTLFVFVLFIFTGMAAAQDIGIVTAKRADIHSAASLKSKVLATARENSKIKILSVDHYRSWYPAQHGKILGWIYKDDFEFVEPELEKDRVSNASPGSNRARTLAYYRDHPRTRPEWVLFHTAKDEEPKYSNKFSYKRSSLIRTGPNVYRAWIKQHMDGDKAYSLELYEVKCKAKKLSILEIKDYDARGKITSARRETARRFQDAAPDTVGGVVVEGVCRASRGL